MDLSFTKINGTNGFLNYDVLKRSIINELSSDCETAEVLILNNFPVPVTSQTSLDFLIFLKVPSNLSKKPKIHVKENFVYISNLIIAVSVINDYYKSVFEIDGTQLVVNDKFLYSNDHASKLKWGLSNYLQDACGLKDNITVHPVFWIVNENQTIILENTIVSKLMTFDLIKECIAKNDYLRYPGYIAWNNGDLFNSSIHQIFEQASLDSKLGYLTKQKIERFQNKFDLASQKAFDEIGKKLVEVKGKAGTGKSSDLLKWMLQKSLTGHRATFLTYNHLLVFEISKQILSFHNSTTSESRASTTAETIHAFMYNISKKLGVVLLMSESRINELKKTLDIRLEKIKQIFQDLNDSKRLLNKNDLKNYFQNNIILDQGTKREAIDFIIHDANFRDFHDQTKIVLKIESFKNFKVKVIEDNINSKVFLSDYHNVLKNILLAVQNLDQFLSNFNVESKFDLLETTLKLDKSILVEDGSDRIDLDKLKARYMRSINHFRGGRTLYIDEAQDCHSYERDIFFSLFNPKNVVIASGGKEQLIRYSEVCNWDISKNVKIDKYQYIKKRKSYRMKPAIALFANHIASSFNIDLNIEPLETDDHGTIIIDRNFNCDLNRKVDLINQLLIKASRQGCSAYESLLMLKNSKEQTSSNQLQNSIISNDSNANASIKKFVINEFDNIKIDIHKTKTEWDLISIANEKIKEARFWNATGKTDKKNQSVPGSLSIRAIYYESSRGLESWSTMCFDLDGFFESKRNEPEADNFLLNEIMESKIRKDKYAATWVLMALTRAIDTCYVELKNNDNALINSINRFIDKYPQYIEFV